MPNIVIPSVLIPKTGTKTSSFYVLVAAWIVGGLFTGLFTALEANGYLDKEGAPLIRNWLVEMVAEFLPIVYIAVSGWLTREYLKARGKVAEEKAKAMGEAVKGQTGGAPSAEVNIDQGSTEKN